MSVKNLLRTNADQRLQYRTHVGQTLIWIHAQSIDPYAVVRLCKAISFMQIEAHHKVL